MKTYHGSCHLNGLVRFTVNTTLTGWFRQLFDLLEKGCFHHESIAGEFSADRGCRAEAPYLIFSVHERSQNTISARWWHPSIQRNPRAAPDMFSINVRCLDDFDLATEQYDVSVAEDFDGKNWGRGSWISQPLVRKLNEELA